MTCHEFLTLWNDRLDDPASLDLAAIDAHSAECADCAGLAAGFRVLGHRLAAPAVPEGLSDRIIDAWRADVAARKRRRALGVRAVLGGVGVLAAAAAFLLYVTSGAELVPVAPRLVPAPRPWTSALADATSATLDLARETSAPAARLGQLAFDSARPGDLDLRSSMPIGSSPPASDLLQSVSDRVSSGVRPISGSARRAFSFLSAPAGGDRRSPPRDPGA